MINAELGIRQDICYDVRDFSSVELHKAVPILNENILGLGGCGSMASECPVIVRFGYKDIHGNAHEWLHGLFIGDPTDGWPIHGWHERLEPGT